MLGHLMGAKTVAIATMMAIFLTNHGMLAGDHPGTSRGLDIIVEKGGVPANFH